jgi:hypothetical protein
LVKEEVLQVVKELQGIKHLNRMGSIWLFSKIVDGRFRRI